MSNLNWYDASGIPFDALLLFEKFQISRFCSNRPITREIRIAFNSNPKVLWYFRHRNPEVSGWVDAVADKPEPADPYTIRACEIVVLNSAQDWLAYVWDPTLYDRQPFLSWNDSELLDLTDFRGKWVLDVGSGTCRLAFTIASLAPVVYACEPVGNLREYLRSQIERRGLHNTYVVDGMIESLPFPEDTFDVVMAGHVFGDNQEGELTEMMRVARPGGMIILCPGNRDIDNLTHEFLTAKGFEWSAFEEPGTGFVRKYWLKL